MNLKDRSSILLSLFKRKGGEGIYTRIVDDHNKHNYESVISLCKDSERALIIYYQNDTNWVLITNCRILMNNKGGIAFILNSDLTEVHPALHEEYKAGIMDKKSFTKLKLKDKYSKEYIVEIENGLPYQGVYQLLHFIAGNG